MQQRRKFRSRPHPKSPERYIWLIDGVAVSKRTWDLKLEPHARYEWEVVAVKK